MFAVTAFPIWLACVALVARAFPLLGRDVVVPRITSPTADSVWPVGSVQTVTWDTSNFPPDDRITNPRGRVLLGFDENDSLNLDFDHPLAQGFSIKDGSVQVTVPDVPPKDNYLIVLMGNSGNASPVFAITRISNVPPSSSSVLPSSSTSQAPPAPSPPSTVTDTLVAAPANPVVGTGSTLAPTDIGDAAKTAQPTPTPPTTTVDQTTPSNSPDGFSANATGAGTSIQATSLFGLSTLCVGFVSFTVLLAL